MLKLAILVVRDRGKEYTKRGVRLKAEKKKKNILTFEKEQGVSSSRMEVSLDLAAGKNKAAKALVSFEIQETGQYVHPQGAQEICTVKNLSLERTKELIAGLQRMVELGEKFEKEY